jgi:hypothetical protein
MKKDILPMFPTFLHPYIINHIPCHMREIFTMLHRHHHHNSDLKAQYLRVLTLPMARLSWWAAQES